MSHYYDIIYIQQYLDGKLSPEQMYELERAALNDALLQDAIDGYRSAEAVDHKQLSLLQKRFVARLETHQENKNRIYFTWQRLAIASIAGLLLIVIGVLFWMMRNPDNSTRVNSQAQQASIVNIQDKVTISLVDGDISPKVGWDAFRDHASIAPVPASAEERVVVRFDLIDNRPSSIQFISKNSNQVTEAVKKMLVEGSTWDGHSGTLELQF